MPKPNILFILTDDLGWRDLSCFGSTFYETPHLDRLASGGMVFTDAYAACPVCSPTRGSLMTGKYPPRVGITDYIDVSGKAHPRKYRMVEAPYLHNLHASERTLPTSLRDGGYQTWHVGKWHLGGEGSLPQQRGFDVNVGGCEHGAPMGKGGYFAPWKLPPLKDAPVPEGTYLDEYLTQKARELIEKRDRSKPFFLNFWHYLVHTPIEAPEALVEKYHEKARKLGLDRAEAIIPGEPVPSDPTGQRRVMRRVIQSNPVYAAMVEIMDTCVGRLVQTLHEQAIENNTLVVFTSDNGGLATSEGSPTCNLPLAEGKGWLEEGGVREPLICHWPGVIEAGSVCREPVTSPDFYPTFLEAAGLPLDPKQHVDGVSFMPRLRGEEKTPPRGPVFWHYPHYGNQGGTPSSSIRDGDWKLIEYFEDGRIELYHLPDDPSEVRERSKAEPEITRSLHKKLVDWRKDVGALYPEKNAAWTVPQVRAEDYTHPTV